MDRNCQAFALLNGRPPRGVPYVVKVSVAAEHKDLRTAVLSHYCFVELPVSKHKVLSLANLQGTQRKWTDQSNKTYQSALLNCDGTMVSLIDIELGGTTELPIDKLSDFDRAWLGIPKYEPTLE